MSSTEALDRAGNVLGALSLLIVDRMGDAVRDAAGRSPTAAAALSSLSQFLDRPSVDRLGQVLGLTHSGTVRLVDRLEADGFVRRAGGADGRSVSISLTAAGRRAASRVISARDEVLSSVVAVLTRDERKTLEQLASRLLVGMMRGPGATRWGCRLCDFEACGHDEKQCPITRADDWRRP
jgi:DNA-binding MarR family transcriptional regulator